MQHKNQLGLMLGFIVLTLLGCSSEPTTTKPDDQKSPIPPTENVADYPTSTLDLHEISTFDVYADGDVIYVAAAGKLSEKGKKIGIYHVHSEDGGRTWSKPKGIAHIPNTIAIRGNDIQFAAKDKNLLVIWQGEGELPSMGPMLSAYSKDGGETWRLGPNPAANDDGDQSHLDLIADEHGNFHVAWLEDPEENGYQSLRYARSVDWGKDWNEPTTLDDSTCSCCWNKFALSSDNEMNLFYRDMKPRDMALIQSFDDGKTWRPNGIVGEFGWKFDGCPHNGGSLAFGKGDNQRHLHSLVWTGVADKPGLYYLKSKNAGNCWSKAQRLGKNAVHADIATYGDEVFAIWDELEAEGSSIFYAKADDNADDLGKWSDSKRLTLAKNAATHPRLVATKHGVLALWTEKPSKQAGRLAWQIIE